MGWGQWEEGIAGTIIKDTWTKSGGMVEVGEGGGFSWGGVEGWGEKAYNCNGITIKIKKKKKSLCILSCIVLLSLENNLLALISYHYPAKVKYLINVICKDSISINFSCSLFSISSLYTFVIQDNEVRNVYLYNLTLSIK